MEQAVLWSVDNGVASITLNRPKQHNALNQELLSGLYDCIDKVTRQDEIRVAILTGAGKSFSAGIDLQAAMKENLLDPRGDGRDLPDIFASCPKPIIGAINGHAITGGFEIALSCDFMIASDRAVFTDSHAKLGIHPGWGMTQLLQQAVGQRRAKQLSFTAQPLPAYAALSWGLVNEVVPHEMLLPRCRQIAEGIGKANPHTLQAVKSLIEYRNASSFDHSFSREREGFQEFVGSVQTFLS